jgi:hypothetical protein
MYDYSFTVQGILAHGLSSVEQMVFWCNPTVVIELPLLLAVVAVRERFIFVVVKLAGYNRRVLQCWLMNNISYIICWNIYKLF